MADTCSGAAALSIPIEEQTKQQSSLEPTSEPLTPDDGAPTGTCAKRSADDALERQPAKMTKLTGDGSGNEHVEPSESKECENASGDKMGDLQLRLERAEAELSMRTAESKYYQDRHDELLYRVAEEDMKQGKKPLPKSEQAQAQAVGKAMVQKERQTIRARYLKTHDEYKRKRDEEVKALKEDHAEKIGDLRDRHERQMMKKEKGHARKVQEIEEKAAKKAEEFKEAKTSHAEEIKNMKAEHQKIQKELKLQQAEDLKALKPEHSKVVKEKDAALREKQQATIDSAEALKKSDKEKTELSDEIRMLKSVKDDHEKAMAQKHSEYLDLQYTLRLRDEDVRRVLDEKAALETAHEAKIVHEGKRWQLQYDKAEKTAHSAMELQRANFVLRHSLDSKNKKIEGMQAELLTLQERVSGLRKQPEGSDTSN